HSRPTRAVASLDDTARGRGRSSAAARYWCWSRYLAQTPRGRRETSSGIILRPSMGDLGDKFHPRVHEPARALARHGDRARRCFAALERCDPPADALVEWLADRRERFDLEVAWRAWRAGESQP